MEAERDSIKGKLLQITNNHREEIKILAERLRNTEEKMNQVIDIFDRDINDWRKEKAELLNLKKFYYSRIGVV